MPRMHELLAIDTQVKGQAQAATADLKNTFEKKRHSHFVHKITTFKSNKEGVEPKVEQAQELQTTVRRELKWLGDKLAAALDIGHQVDVGNTLAKADVVLDDGTTLLKDVPGISLLQIGHRLKELQDFVATIPTQDPAQGFKRDEKMSAEGDAVAKALDVEKPRTEKIHDWIIAAPATKEHPAQVKDITRDVVIGTVLVQEWTGLITTGEKGDMLDRVEEVARAVKAARSRANELELNVKTNRVGKQILDYVFNGIK